MKRLLALTAATAATASAFTVECLQTHSNFFPGLDNQPCLRLKVNATAGEKIIGMTFTTGETTLPSNISKAYLKSTGSVQLYMYSDESAQPETVATSATASTGSIIFNDEIPLNEGDNYFWLCYDVASGAKGGNKIGGECVALTDGNGQYVLPADGKTGAQGKPGKVYEFKYRIAPYHRARWLAQNWKKVASATHFKYCTDYIVFGLSQSNGSFAYYGATEDEYNTALAKAKQLRGTSACHIICGFAISENTKNDTGDTSSSFGDVIADSTRRRDFAKLLAQHLEEKGFDGLDIDYEYPAQSKNGSWWYFSEFLSDLREEMAGTGMSLSIAVTARYDKPSRRVYDQCDFVHLMSYGAPGDHETQALVESDVSWARKAKIPDCKIVPGLGFFSRDRLQTHNDNGGIVYADIVEQYPSISASANTFINKKDSNKEHYFNGATMIKSKCKYVVQQKLGGVIIWGFDGDMPVTHAKSLSKAMYTVLKQTKR